jgi:hypothetical protein
MRNLVFTLLSLVMATPVMATPEIPSSPDARAEQLCANPVPAPSPLVLECRHFHQVQMTARLHGDRVKAICAEAPAAECMEARNQTPEFESEVADQARRILSLAH